MDAIEQLSGSFGDGELAAEVKRLEAKCAEQRALLDRWNACNAREVEAMNKAGKLVAEMRERCVQQDAEIERLRAELAAEREAVRVLGEECGSWRDADMYGDMLGTIAGDYDEFDATGYAHREHVRTAKSECDNCAIASAAIAKGSK